VGTALVRVRGTGLSERPGADGSFAFPELTAGEYTVEVTAPGYVPQQTEVSAPEGGQRDLGTIELEPSETVYVSVGGSDAVSGLTPEDAVRTFPKALAVAAARGITNIEVAGGIYDLHGQSIKIHSQMRIDGGYSAGNWTDPDPVNHETTIVGADNIFEITASSGVLVSNMTLIPEPSTDPTEWSRGFAISGSNTWIVNVKISHEASAGYAKYEALGIYDGSAVALLDCELVCADTTDHVNGIHVMHGSELRLENTNLIVGDSGHDSAAFGVHVTEGSFAELIGSSVSVAPTSFGNIGVLIGQSGSAVLRDGTQITAGESADDQSIGVRVSGNGEVTVRNATITGGDSEAHDSFGISVGGTGRLVVRNSTVVAGASDAFSAGITVRDLAAAEITDNVAIQGGTAYTDEHPDVSTAGIHVETTSGAVEIFGNDSIVGAVSGSGFLPAYSDGILLTYSGPVGIFENAIIDGGDARFRAVGIRGFGISGTLAIAYNDSIYGGAASGPASPTDKTESTWVGGIDVESDSSNAYARIYGNTVSGGQVTRPAEVHGSSAGVSVHGEMEVLIQENLIDGGTVDNQGGFGETATPEYHAGPTCVIPGARRVTINRNDLRVLQPRPVSVTTPVFVRAVHGGLPGGQVIAKNNQVLLYNIDAPIHVFEPGQFTDFIVTNNTVVVQVDDNATDSWDHNSIGLWASHAGSSIALTNNLWYAPSAASSPTVAPAGADGLADPEEFDYNYVLGFSGSLTGPTTWEGNTVDGGGTVATDVFVNPDTDLSDGYDGDLRLEAGAPVIDAGVVGNKPELGNVTVDFDGNDRQPSSVIEFPETGDDTTNDIGAFEYQAN
jgi:hypothetical protein